MRVVFNTAAFVKGSPPALQHESLFFFFLCALACHTFDKLCIYLLSPLPPFNDSSLIIQLDKKKPIKSTYLMEENVIIQLMINV